LQYDHMGRDLFETEPTIRHSMLEMNLVVHDIAGYSVLEQLYSDRHNRSEPLDDICISHPGIFMVEHALATWMTTNSVLPGAYTATASARIRCRSRRGWPPQSYGGLRSIGGLWLARVVVWLINRGDNP
jgi:hypothetical protein